MALNYGELTELAQGRNATLIDLIIVGDIDKLYLYRLIEKVEPLIEKKIRVALFTHEEFTPLLIQDIGIVVDLLEPSQS